MLKRQVDELKSMLSDVKDAMVKFPQPPREPERLLLCQSGGLLDIGKEDSAHRVMSEACKEVIERWGVAALINIAGDYTLECKGGYFPTDVAAWTSQDGQKILSQSADLCGFKCAKRTSPCAHVIANEGTVWYSGANDKPAALNHQPEEVARLASTDPALAQQMQLMQSGGNFFSSLDVDDATKQKLQVRTSPSLHTPAVDLIFHARTCTHTHSLSALCSLSFLGERPESGQLKPQNDEN